MQIKNSLKRVVKYMPKILQVFMNKNLQFQTVYNMILNKN